MKKTRAKIKSKKQQSSKRIKPSITTDKYMCNLIIYLGCYRWDLRHIFVFFYIFFSQIIIHLSWYNFYALRLWINNKNKTITKFFFLCCFFICLHIYHSVISKSKQVFKWVHVVLCYYHSSCVCFFPSNVEKKRFIWLFNASNCVLLSRKFTKFMVFVLK